MFCIVLDQFCNGEMDKFSRLNHRQILDKVTLYVLQRIERSLFKNQSELDEQFSIRASNLQWVTPEQFGLANSIKTYKPHLWAIAADFIKQVELAASPAEKVQLINQAVRTIQISFRIAYAPKEIYPSADDLIPALVFVACKAQLRTPFLLDRYIDMFSRAKKQMDQTAQ